MTMKEDLKEIRIHTTKMNEELGCVQKNIAIIKNEIKWHKWLMLVCLALILALFGLNIKMPAPYIASGLSILSFGLR